MQTSQMNLGPFSVSLNVKNINKSQIFYEALGFHVIDGGHINHDFPDSENAK